MPASQAQVDHYAPGCKLEVNGVALDPEAAAAILSLKIDQELNKTNSFTFEIQDEFRAGHFRWLETDLFRVANPVSVQIGYTQHLVKLVEGRIKNVNASFNMGCAPTFTVEGTDTAYDLLTTPSETKVYTEKRDSDIVQEIAGLSGLDPDVDPTQAVTPVKTKAGGKSYLDFLQVLANENNYDFYLGGRRLHFRQEANRESRMTLSWGKNLIRFEPQLNTSSAVTEVRVRAWDANSKTFIEGRARAGEEFVQEGEKQTSSQFAKSLFGDVVKVITDRPVRSTEEATKLAQSELNSAANNLVQATVETVGMPELIPGVCLSLTGFGALFSGKYYIVKATHNWGRDGYRTSLSVRRNAV
ncbi:MAG: phage late control D family protein [Verrucomicrobiales bacterium]|nr:phage late control D family protein [Verrucomicrobiales bacterium]